MDSDKYFLLSHLLATLHAAYIMYFAGGKSSLATCWG